MRRRGWIAAAVLLLATASGTAAVVGPYGSAEAVAAPTHAISVEGAGSVSYPAFSSGVERYAVRPGAGWGSALTVTVSTSDPAGSARVNGRPVVAGTTTVTGLQPGDEISVIITDEAGVTPYSFVVLPLEFPVLTRTTPLDPRTTSGATLLTLGKWLTASPFFETAVDENGVPLYVHQTPSSMDFKRLANGHYSVARGGANGADIVELDEQFRAVRQLRTKGLVHTDAHDSILAEDGSAYLLSYEANPATGLTDAVIQQLSATGDVLFQWNSADHVDVAAESVVASDDPDYAHVNSIEVMSDGDLLVSFRHLSSVFKIARSAHDGFAVGDVVWRLGGRASDFAFVDTAGQPDGGPCAQHTATELPNGDIMVFDNGAWNLQPLCIDPANPSGPPVARVPTRVAQWSIDQAAGTATMVKDLRVNDRYAVFAGSAQPLVGGNTLLGWASSTQAVATELSATGEVLWELQAPEDPKYFTYRAQRAVVPDAIAPVIAFSPGSEQTAVDVGASEVPGLSCTDRGGSSLTTCAVTGFDTTTPGERTMTIVATDGAGNRTSLARTYVVRAPATPTPDPTSPPTTPTTVGPTQTDQPRYRPDLHVKALGRGWRGIGVWDVRAGQVASTSASRARSVFRIRLRNDGLVADRFTVRLTGAAQVRGAAWATNGQRSPRLAPGETLGFRIVVRRGRTEVSRVRVVARSTRDADARDRVWTRTRWR